MIATGTAILASAAVAAGSQAIAGNAAKKGVAQATAAETAANDKALALQERMYNQTRADNEPWRQVGIGALQQLAQTYNINVPQGTWSGTAQPVMQADLTPRPYPGQPAPTGLLGNVVQAANAPAEARAKQAWDANEAARVAKARQDAVAQTATPGSPAPQPGGQFGAFFASPDYQFRVNQGITAITGNRAARGLLDSASLGKGLMNYGQEAGAQEYGNWFLRLSSLAGIGQSANQSNIAAAQNNAAAQGGIIQNQGQNLSSSYQTAAGINAGMINSIGNTGAGLIQNYGWGAGRSPAFGHEMLHQGGF